MRFSALLLALAVGVGAGGIATLFQLGIDWMLTLRTIFIDSALAAVIPTWGSAFIFGAVLAGFAYFLVIRFAPESGGSGVPEIEGAMAGKRPVRWKHVLPVKFFSGLGVMGAGMVLGREGPSIQIGANFARMLSDLFNVKDKQTQNALLAGGAAGGLTAAFNAPIASVLFVIEEMRDEFSYRYLSIKMVTIACLGSVIIYRLIQGQEPVASVPDYLHPPLNVLWLYALLGVVIGLIAPLFNYTILHGNRLFANIYRGRQWRFVAVGALLGGGFSVLLSYYPHATQGGLVFSHSMLTTDYSIGAILLLFAVRYVATAICFCSGAPGGIFAPLLIVGTTVGLLFATVALAINPELNLVTGAMGVVGMAALFGCTVRAPLTGILLVLEITQDFELILPMMITTLCGNVLSALLKTQPLYSAILAQKLAK